MDAVGEQTLHSNELLQKTVWPSQPSITYNNPDRSDAQPASKIPRTFSADSGYFSHSDSGETLGHGSSENRKASIEEAEHFLASIRDTVPTILGADVLTSTPEEMVEEDTQVPEPNNELVNIDRQEDIDVRESQIWEGTFDSSSSKGRKQSRSSSTNREGIIDPKQKMRRLSTIENQRILLSQDLEWKAVEADACVFAAMSGRERSGVITFNSIVSEEAAQAANNWAHRVDVFDPEARYLRITMYCYSKDACQWSSLSNDTDQGKRTGLAAACKTTPSKENAWSSLPPTCVILGDSSWSMFDLAKHVGPFEISGKLKPGNNSIQIAHLGDTSNFLFILFAEQPSPIEKMAANLEHLRDQRKKAFRDFLILHSSPAKTSHHAFQSPF